MAGISANTACFTDVGLQRINVDSGLVDHGAVTLQHMGDQRAVLLRQEQGGVIAHIAKPLHDHPLAFQAGGKPGLGDIGGLVEEGAEGIFDAAPRGLGPAGDAALGHRLSGDAGPCVDFRGMEPLVFIRHPGHFALAGADIGGRDVL